MTQHKAYPSPALAWWAIVVLFLAYTMSFVDRTILSLLVEPLRRDLHISDTQVSLLQGLAFAIFYTTMGLPIAILADRHSRRTIIGIGIFFWSLMTAACGLAGSFAQLFVARLGVGVGEAALSPATYSLIADLFPENKRGRALGVFASGVNVGAGLALIIGGAVIGLSSQVDAIQTPFGEFRSWQLVFIIVGLPGLLVAVLAMTIHEPRRTASGTTVQPPPGEFRKFLRTYKGAVTAHFIGFSLCGLAFSGVAAWAPTFFIRHFGYTPAHAGQGLGIAMLIFGTLGSLAGGVFCDRWVKLPDGTLRTGLLGIAMQMCATVAAPLVADPTLSLVLFSVVIFFAGFCYTAGAAGIQKLAPPMLRARMSAFYLLVVSAIGTALGPTSIALLTDRFFKNPADVGYSIALALGVIGPIACVVFLVGLKPFARAIVDQTAVR